MHAEYGNKGFGTCPVCGCGTNRIPRRTVDKVISWFYPVERYYCLNPACSWEGVIKAEKAAQQEADALGR